MSFWVVKDAADKEREANRKPGETVRQVVMERGGKRPGKSVVECKTFARDIGRFSSRDLGLPSDGRKF